jgi:SNF2 family DNA or RNA helicase
MQLEDVSAGVRLSGLIAGETAAVLAVERHGADAATITYRSASGSLGERVIYREDAAALSFALSPGRPFDAPADEFKLAAEAQRIGLAGAFDPMLAVVTSDVQPLPHQIRAVYGEMLPRTPLRFLLADDPGAGKTIMAGLYIKELLLRHDVNRALVVAPGGLVDQWQDELFHKFGLRFEILTNAMIEASLGASVFDGHPLLVARMDQLSRNDELLAALAESEWDLVVVDEAHRMGAHWFGGKLEKTKRFQLGELLGERTRHLLLMTATPHSGKEQDFYAFLTLLDRDRFEGPSRGSRSGGAGDTAGLMRRMVKEDLLTFEGRPLFPERIAQTVPYQLTALESELYGRVTDYVRDGMNRADALDGQRRSTVGFALTVLQRRVASSPEAIYQSLVRRTARLERRRQDVMRGENRSDDWARLSRHLLDDDDEYSAAESEEAEEELVDAATAARTAEELQTEIVELAGLIELAERVRRSETDRKWVELRTILQENTLGDAGAHKLIVFTEHRDTLDYLARRVGTLLGRPEAVVAIHGGVPRMRRREITEEFTKNPDCRILLATDAAGEGLNLQAAHLVVNYDLPWNPNRIEQRFGRVHRIGQTQVCRLWNLVAQNTREGQVFARLLDKVEEQRRAYGGRVFDVLGAAFSETPLRDLLIDAIRYGELPEVRDRMNAVIDATVSDGLTELLHERAMAAESLAPVDVERIRRQMADARARRLQPHYISSAFRAAFQRLGGRMARRERGRFEISNVPAALRSTPRPLPVATRYERVTFDLDTVDSDSGRPADLLAPGHPLHDAVMQETVRRFGPSLDRGTVLVSGTISEALVLIGVLEDVVDGAGTVVSRRFGYVFVDRRGGVMPAGPAPYLDCVAAPEPVTTTAIRTADWTAQAESAAVGWIIEHELPEYLAEVVPRRAAELARTREQVERRLNQEINRLAGEAMVAADSERRGSRPRQSAESLGRRAAGLEVRLERRRAELDRQAQMSTRPPRVTCAALVLPVSAIQEPPPDVPAHAVATKEVERRGVDLVLATERGLGRHPIEQAFNNKGFDVLSEVSGGDSLRIEVKARIAGAETFDVTHSEVMLGKNAAPHYRLALVRVDPRGAEHDEVRYLDDPFRGVEPGMFDATGWRGDWGLTWAKGREPW